MVEAGPETIPPNLRDAFHFAVLNTPRHWSGGDPDAEIISLDRKLFTPSVICGLLAKFADPMPRYIYDVLRELGYAEGDLFVCPLALDSSSAAGKTSRRRNGAMSRPKLEVADIFRDHGAAWRRANAGHVSLDQMKVMSAIERCRTAALGGHVARCDGCAHTVIAYNSCRNRHCPKCQGAAAKQWLAAREEPPRIARLFGINSAAAIPWRPRAKSSQGRLGVTAQATEAMPKSKVPTTRRRT
jgi:hypothetical protein